MVSCQPFANFNVSFYSSQLWYYKQGCGRKMSLNYTQNLFDNLIYTFHNSQI